MIHLLLNSKLILLVLITSSIVSCSFNLPEKNNNLSRFHWSVEGGDRIGDALKQWINTNQQNETSLQRIITIETPQRRRRIIGLDLAGVAFRYLHETIAMASVLDADGVQYGTLRLFASRQYPEDSDSNLFLDRLNEEMDRELSNQLIIWLQKSNFNSISKNSVAE